MPQHASQGNDPFEDLEDLAKESLEEWQADWEFGQKTP